MSAPPPTPDPEGSLVSTAALTNRERYQLLTSLVVPRPIGWVSSSSSSGIANLAPFSYFAAISATPMLLGLSIGTRGGSPKDTLTNIRESGVFCVNVVTERHLAAMNESSGEHPPDVDEFEVAGVHSKEGELVAAPYVADCPAVFECGLYREMELGEAGNVFVVGEIVAVHLSPELQRLEGTRLIDPRSLRPVARLGGELYSLLGEIAALPRPVT